MFFAGFYADPEARCQVFHVCGLSSGLRPQQSFLCPNGTLFNVQVKTCDWWTNVECSSDPVQKTKQQLLRDVQQHLTSREETQLSSLAAKMKIKERRISEINRNGEPYDLPTSSIEKEVKINFNRSKSILDAFNTYHTSDNSFSKTLVTEDDKDTKSNLRSIDRKVNFPNELGLRTTVNEVNIQPRPKYTHSYVTSSTRSPILSVTTYLNPTEKSLVILKDTSKQNKNLKSDKENERNPLKKPMRFFDTGIGTEFNTELYNRETEVENSSYIMSKYNINKQHQNNHSSEKLSLTIENMSEQHPFLANDYLYFAQKKPLNVPEIYSVQDTTGVTQENSKLRNNASLKEISAPSSTHKIYGEREGFENYDRKITTHNVARGDRTALDEAPLVKKLVGENGQFTLLLNEFKQKTEENPDDQNSKTERYLDKFVNDKKNKKYILPLTDTLSRTEESYVNENKNTNPPRLDHSTPFSKNSLVLNEFLNEHRTSQIGNLFTTGLHNDFKEGNNQLQNVRTQNSFDGGKPLSKEREQGISISKQNLTYEEHIIEPLPKIKVKPELFISSNSSSKSYVSVPNFSSFPELYTSPVSGYYITELPPGIKQLPSNFKENYDGRAKNRITRLDGESYKLESTTENSLQTNSDLLLSETESIYATPKSTSTHSYEEFENQNKSNINLNTSVTEETLLEATKKLLLESHRETNLENDSFLGPELLFENSHVVWPNFPPRSLFYSPYPALTRSKSQLGATEPLTFFPRPPKRNKVYPSNNNSMRYDDANHDQESSQATEHYSSSTTNFDLAKVLESEVLRQFLSHSPDKVVQSFPDTQPSTILIQPTVEVYSESTSSNPLEETSFKLGPSHSSTPSEMEHENASLAFSTLQTDYMPLHDENVYDGVRKGEDLQKINYTVNRVPNIPLTEDLNTAEHTETQESLLITSQSSSTSSPGHNHELKTILEPPDVLDINGLRSSSETTVNDSFKHSEIVKSLSFDFDSPEGREQFEAARSRGLFKR